MIEMSAMVERHQLRGHVRLAVALHPEHNALVGHCHGTLIGGSGLTGRPLSPSFLGPFAMRRCRRVDDETAVIDRGAVHFAICASMHGIEVAQPAYNTMSNTTNLDSGSISGVGGNGLVISKSLCSSAVCRKRSVSL